MLSSGRQAADFIKVLYNTLQANNLRHVGINCCENTGWKYAVDVTRELQTAGVEDMLYAIASHPYTDALGAPLNTTARVWENRVC
jgi:hypothetical protein